MTDARLTKEPGQKNRAFLVEGTACFRQKDAIFHPERTERHVFFDRTCLRVVYCMMYVEQKTCEFEK